MSSVGDAARRVRASWAVWSKHAGAAMGYTLLACGGDTTQAARLIEAGMTGTPEDECLGAIDALPWLSFVGAAGDEPAALGVVVQSWSGERDATGQTIVPSRLLTIAWPDEASACPGFVGLSDAIRSIAWAGVDGPPCDVAPGEPLVVAPQPMNVDLVVQTISELDFEWVLAVAVALLDGQRVVIIPHGDKPSYHDRVRLLDAVCALLPYGCRAWLSAATWARARSQHDIRLSFAEQARTSQRAIPYSAEMPAVAPQNPAVRAYYDEMRKLRGGGVATAAIIAHLAARHEPLPEEKAGLAVTHLQDLRLPEAVREEIQDGRGDPARVDRVLQKLGWQGLAASLRTLFGRFLAEETSKGSLPAVDTLRRHWTPDLVATLADGVAEDVIAARADSARWPIDAAMQMGKAQRDEMVAAVVERVAPSSSRSAVASRTITLLAETKSLSLDNVRAWQVFAVTPELGARALRQYSSLPDTAEFVRLFDAIRPFEGLAGAEWLSPVRELFGPGAVDSVPSSCSDVVLTLLFDVAVATRRLLLFLCVAWPSLLRLGYATNSAGEFPRLKGMAQTVLGVDLARAPIEVRACVDVFAAGIEEPLRGAPPYPPPDAHAQQTWRGYLAALLGAWHALPEPGRKLLESTLPGAVLGGTLDAASFHRLIEITDTLDRARLHRSAVQQVGRLLTSKQDLLLTLHPDEAWIDELVAFAPEYRWFKHYFVCRGLAEQPATTVATIRDAYRGFRGRGAPAQWAVTAIWPWVERRGATGMTDLLLSFGESDQQFASDPHFREIHSAVFASPLGPDVVRRTFLLHDCLSVINEAHHEAARARGLRITHDAPSSQSGRTVWRKVTAYFLGDGGRDDRTG